MGPLIPLFWTSGDICPGFENQGGPLSLFASLRILHGMVSLDSSLVAAKPLLSFMLKPIDLLLAIKNVYFVILIENCRYC